MGRRVRETPVSEVLDVRHSTYTLSVLAGAATGRVGAVHRVPVLVGSLLGGDCCFTLIRTV